LSAHRNARYFKLPQPRAPHLPPRHRAKGVLHIPRQPAEIERFVPRAWDSVRLQPLYLTRFLPFVPRCDTCPKRGSWQSAGGGWQKISRKARKGRKEIERLKKPEMNTDKHKIETVTWTL